MTVITRTNILILMLLILISCQSCQFFDTKVSKDKLLQKEINAVNWKKVDEFPSISECETIGDDAQQQQCFFEFLSADIKSRIKNNVKGATLFRDTIFVKIIVTANSKVLFETQESKSNNVFDSKKIDSILRNDTLKFPIIKPALKRGMLVKSEFVLPIIF